MYFKFFLSDNREQTCFVTHIFQNDFFLDTMTSSKEKSVLRPIIFEQVNSAKQVEKDVKVLKAKISDDGVLDKSLEANLYKQQGRGDSSISLSY